MIPVSLWEYRGTVDSVFDGDTLRASIDLGFGIWQRGEPLRLLGINAPEMRNETLTAGRMARDALRARVQGRAVWIRTVKPTVDNFPSQEMKDKYGRFLATIWDDAGNVNEWMVTAGHAVPYMP